MLSVSIHGMHIYGCAILYLHIFCRQSNFSCRYRYIYNIGNFSIFGVISAFDARSALSGAVTGMLTGAYSAVNLLLYFYFGRSARLSF